MNKPLIIITHYIKMCFSSKVVFHQRLSSIHHWINLLLLLLIISNGVFHIVLSSIEDCHLILCMNKLENAIECFHTIYCSWNSLLANCHRRADGRTDRRKKTLLRAQAHTLPKNRGKQIGLNSIFRYILVVTLHQRLSSMILVKNKIESKTVV